MSPPAVVSTEWLLQNLSAPEVVVVDCSWDDKLDMEKEYNAAHIPGAVYMNPLHNTTSSFMYPRPMPTPEVMEPYIRSIGINQASHVIVYDNNGQCGFFISGRAWWMLKYFGHQRVSILNGGFQQWTKTGNSITSGIPQTQIGDFTINLQPNFLATLDEMEKNLIDKKCQVVDTRPKFKYQGKETDSSTGHYPGAINVPFPVKLINSESGLLRTEAELREGLQSAGVDLSRDILVTCNAGMSSATMIVISQLLNFKAKLYVTGMVEWGQKRADALVQGTME